MAICLSVGGPTVYRSNAPLKDVLVATAEGVTLLSRSGPGDSWDVRETWLQGKHSSTLMEPRPGFIVVGTHEEGVFISEDGGRTWERRDRGLVSPNVYATNFVEAGGQLRLYSGTEPAHLHVSTDMGRTWQELPSLRNVPSVDQWTFPGPPHIAHVKYINFDPRDPETIYAGIEVGGLLKSRDGGRTWRELHGIYEDFHHLEIAPTRPNDLWVSDGAGIYHSPDGGETWEQLTDHSARIAYPDPLVVHPERSQLMFVGGGRSSPDSWRKTGTADARIARSRDSGRTWEVLEKGLPEHIHGNIEAMSINVWPGGFALFAGNTDGDIFYSDDEGETWSTIARVGPVSKAGHFRALAGAGAGR